MNWVRENRMLVIAFGAALVVAIVLLFMARGSYAEAMGRYSEAMNERTRLERLDPFPNEANVRKMKSHLENYAASLDRLKADLKTRVPAPGPLAPDQFQTQLRQAASATAERAKANRVKLPDNFYLGFEDYISKLPTTEEAPLLGQQLAQIQTLVNVMIDAHVDSISALRRNAAGTTGVAAATATPAPAGRPAAAVNKAQQTVQRASVEFAFTSTSSTARRVLNQINTAPDGFYGVRVLHVKNEKDKGPPRVATTEAATTPAVPAPNTKPGASQAIQIVIGNEHIETAARVELVRFTF